MIVLCLRLSAQDHRQLCQYRFMFLNERLITTEFLVEVTNIQALALTVADLCIAAGFAKLC